MSISVSLTEDHHPLLDAIGRGLLSGLHLPRGGGGHRWCLRKREGGGERDRPTLADG